MNNFFSALPVLYRNGYSYGMVVLIIFYFIFKNKRPTIVSFISIANGWLVVYALIEIGTNLSYLYYVWSSPGPYEGYTFQYSRGNIFSPYGFEYYGQYILLLLTVVLFGFKKMRTKIWLSIIIVIVLHFSVSPTYLISLYRDYIPSSFSFYPDPYLLNRIKGIAIFCFLIVITYWLMNKRAASKAQLWLKKTNTKY